jgi:hypothetical protein
MPVILGRSLTLPILFRTAPVKERTRLYLHRLI